MGGWADEEKRTKTIAKRGLWRGEENPTFTEFGGLYFEGGIGSR